MMGELAVSECARGLMQVPGCGQLPSNSKTYYVRYKICPTHCKAPEVLVRSSNSGGRVLQRFCQQVKPPPPTHRHIPPRSPSISS